MARKKTSTTDESTNVEVKPAKGSTERTNAFRTKLAASDLKRWEIVTTQEIIAEVRRISKSAGMTSNVAAEVLLKLGIETYLTRFEGKAPIVSDDEKVPKMSDILKSGKLLLPYQIDPITGNALRFQQIQPVTTKTLSSYSSRLNTDLSESDLPPPSTETKNVTNFDTQPKVHTDLPSGLMDRARHTIKPS